MSRRRRTRIAAPLATAIESCEPRRLFAVVAPAFADQIGLANVLDYNPTFEDNFNGSSLDKTKWQVRDGYRWRAYKDAPVSTFSYTDETPIQVGNGELQLIAHNDAKTGQLKGAFLQTGRQFNDDSKNSPVPPATLTPGYSGDFEQTYGYWESRAKFSSMPGEWAAFWVHSYRMVEVRDDPTKANQPGIYGAEYDIAEHQAVRQGASATQDVTSIIHANGYGAHHTSKGFYNKTANLKPSKTPPEQYHVYGMLWTSTAVKFYIDGTLVGSTTDPKMISSVPQMAMLSVEVGAGGSNENGQGSNGSGMTPAGGYGSKATSKARATFDYVRVWKLKGQATPTGNSSASGTVYVDTDGDGMRDANEAGRSGVTVWADYDKDGVRDANEPYAVTNASGTYRINNIAPKKAIDLRIVTPSGAKLVAPESSKLSYVTFPGRLEEARNFAISAAGTVTPPPTTPPPATMTATASGVVFVDTDGDGIRDTNEAGRSGAIVWADLDGDGVRDANEKYATTSSTGAYSIAGLAANVSVQIRLATITGFNRTSPAAGYYAYKPTNGQANTAFHFGVKAIPTPPPATTGGPTVKSAVFIDRNGNGIRDAGEVGLGGAIVFIDANYNGKRDANEKYTTTASDGTYTFTGLPVNTSIRLMLQAVTGYKQTLPTGNGGYSFKTYTGMVNTKTNFGLRAG